MRSIYFLCCTCYCNLPSLVQREVAKIGSSEPIFDGGIDLIMTIPQSACSADSPLYTRGPSCAPNRICGGGAPHASERKLDEPIGSAKGMPQGGWCIPPALIIFVPDKQRD